MCEVCAVFGVSEHWTDAAPVDAGVTAAIEIQRHRDSRRLRIEYLNRWLGSEGVSIGDWDGASFVVEDASGRMRVVNDLSELWPAIESVLGRPFDPLQEDLHLGTG